MRYLQQLGGGQVAALQIRHDDMTDNVYADAYVGDEAGVDEFFSELDDSKSHNMSTGKVGIRGLVAVRRMLRQAFSEQVRTGETLCLQPSDEKRERVYWAALKNEDYTRDAYVGWIFRVKCPVHAMSAGPIKLLQCLHCKNIGCRHHPNTKNAV